MKNKTLRSTNQTSIISKSGKIKPKIEDIAIQNHKHPVFCFRYIHKDYSLDKCEPDEKIAFIEQIVRLSKMTWQDVIQAPKHGLGSELHLAMSSYLILRFAR